MASRLGNVQLPPVANVMNVAWQTIRQQFPDKNRPPMGHHGGPRGGPHGERVRFAQVNHAGPDQGHHELSNMTPNQWSPSNEKSQMEDGFNQASYQQSGGGGVPSKQESLSSMDISEDDFVEGKCDIKINEYQAAWNVTNAIQVFKLSIRASKGYFKYTF